MIPKTHSILYLIVLTMDKSLMIMYFLLASALAGVPQPRRINPEFGGRIVGGSDAPDGQYPYQVSIRYGPDHDCGGSIIDNQWILTAAHCVAGFNVEELSVYAGTNTRSNGGTVFKVLQAIYHEGFNPNILANDVALLKVPPITYTEKIQPIILDPEEIGDNEICTLSGWGRLWYPTGPFPENLQHIKLITTPLDYCKKQHENFNPVVDGQFCTFNKAEEGACKGDSGGPLVRKVDGNFKQVGVVSWGQPCALGIPDVFAKVATYIPWIKETCKQCI